MTPAPVEQATVRQATPEDHDAIVAMVGRFLEQTAYKTLAPDHDTIRANVARFIRGEVGRAFVAEIDGPVGVLLAAVYPNLVTGEPQGSEIIWWVEPSARRSGAGLLLLREAETWAALAGATAFHVVAWNPVLERFYGRQGYSKLESVYTKTLEG